MIFPMEKPRAERLKLDPRFMKARRLVEKGKTIKDACESCGLPRISYYHFKRKADASEQSTGLDHSA